MTDKVQKIKEWISKEKDGLMDANGNFEYPEHEGAYHILCNLDAYIDSTQKEPVSKVWHDASERPDYNVGKSVIVGYKDDDDLYDECNNVAYHVTISILVSRKDLNTRVVRWAYLKDLI